MIAQDAATTAARLAEFTGDSVAAAARLDEVIRRAVDADDIVAELRARHYLGGLHLNAGRREQAVRAYREGADRARAKGRPWAPFGMDARALAGIAAIGLGEWALAEEIVDVSDEDPPAIARAALAVVSLLLTAGRGDVARAERLLPVIDPSAAADGMIAVNRAVSLIDLRGDAGDVGAARVVFDTCIATLTAMWETDHSPGQDPAHGPVARPARRPPGAERRRAGCGPRAVGAPDDDAAGDLRRASLDRSSLGARIGRLVGQGRGRTTPGEVALW